MAKTTRNTITEPAYSLLYQPAVLPQPQAINIDEVLSYMSPWLVRQFNDSQQAVFKSSFQDRVTLLWGPPGTGKTTVLAGIVLGWVEKALRAHSPITVAIGSSNWTAIDNLLAEIAKLIQLREQSVGSFNGTVTVNRVRSRQGEDMTHENVKDVIVGTTDSENLFNELENPTNCIIVGSTWKQFYHLSKGNDWRNPAVPHKWFDLLLLDEASQVNVAHAASYFLLLKDNANTVFAGDDKQLGPIFGFPIEDNSDGLFDCIYTYMKETHRIQPKQIVENYRSNDHITSWPNTRFYDGKLAPYFAEKRLEINLPAGKPQQWPNELIWEDKYLDILDPNKPVVAITYPAQTFTVFNPFEAQLVTALTCLYRLSTDTAIYDEAFYEKHLGIVTPHRAQRSSIQHLLTKFSGVGANASIVVDTVDRFQGQERDLIIASYAVADPDFVTSEEAFILDPRRFNVSLTRAKSKFVILVSDAILQHLPADKKIATDAAHLQLFVSKYCKKAAQFPLKYTDANGSIVQVACSFRVLNREQEPS